MKAEIAKRLKALGAETAEEKIASEKAARQKEALDYYREHGEQPTANTTPLGRAWSRWTTKGPSYDPAFTAEARALGWLPRSEKTDALKKEALDYYLEHKNPPPPKTSLGNLWRQWVAKGPNHDPDFTASVSALGWRSRAEVVAVLKKEALDYYREHKKPPPFKTTLGNSWNHWTSKGDSYDPDFVTEARALGWRPRGEK